MNIFDVINDIVQRIIPSEDDEENEPDRIPIVEPLILVVTLYITVQALDYYFPKVVPGGY